MTFDLSKLKFSTKGLIAFLLGLGSLLQVPQVSAPVFAFAKLHPHFAAALGLVIGIIGLLHNPTVDQILGINQTTTVDTTDSTGDTQTASKTVSTTIVTK